MNDLRQMWCKRLRFSACVCCYCERACDEHNVQRCSQQDCLHFLDLDTCIVNKVGDMSTYRVLARTCRPLSPAPVKANTYNVHVHVCYSPYALANWEITVCNVALYVVAKRFKD